MVMALVFTRNMREESVLLASVATPRQCRLESWQGLQDIFPSVLSLGVCCFLFASQVLNKHVVFVCARILTTAGVSWAGVRARLPDVRLFL